MYGEAEVPSPNAGFVFVGAGLWRSLTIHAMYGDLNCDGVVTFDDIDPFISALGTDALSWNLAYPGCYWLNADCNHDGRVDFDDVDPFVALLGR
jgi:hypothetical protein